MKAEIEKEIYDHLQQLPELIRGTIDEADVPAKMRALATQQKLHIDQWEGLEQEVMMTLVGMKEPNELPMGIKNALGISGDLAMTLATAVSEQIFIPVRQKLEEALAHPGIADLPEDTDALSDETISAENEDQLSVSPDFVEPPPAVSPEPPPPTPLPATPPPPPPTQTVEHAPISASYTPGHASSERKDAAGDPYRELPQ